MLDRHNNSCYWFQQTCGNNIILKLVKTDETFNFDSTQRLNFYLNRYVPETTCSFGDLTPLNKYTIILKLREGYLISDYIWRPFTENEKLGDFKFDYDFDKNSVIINFKCHSKTNCDTIRLIHLYKYNSNISTLQSCKSLQWLTYDDFWVFLSKENRFYHTKLPKCIEKPECEPPSPIFPVGCCVLKIQGLDIDKKLLFKQNYQTLQYGLNYISVGLPKEFIDNFVNHTSDFSNSRFPPITGATLSRKYICVRVKPDFKLSFVNENDQLSFFGALRDCFTSDSIPSQNLTGAAIFSIHYNPTITDKNLSSIEIWLEQFIVQDYTDEGVLQTNQRFGLDFNALRASVSVKQHFEFIKDNTNHKNIVLVTDPKNSDKCDPDFDVYSCQTSDFDTDSIETDSYITTDVTHERFTLKLNDGLEVQIEKSILEKKDETAVEDEIHEKVSNMKLK